MNLSMKQIHGHRGQIYGCEEGGAKIGMEWEVGVSRCKLLYMEGINNKILLYITENYIQCRMINNNGKEYGKSIYI